MAGVALGALASPVSGQDRGAGAAAPQAIPGVLPERFRLAGPSPTPTPTPSPEPAAVPVVQPIVVPLARPRPTATPVAQPPRMSVAERDAPAAPPPRSRASSAPQVTAPAATPVRPIPPHVARPKHPPPPGQFPWWWFLAGAGGIAVAGGLAGRTRARRPLPTGEPPQPEATAPPVAVTAPPAPLLPPSAPAEPFEVRVAKADVLFAADSIAFVVDIDVINLQSVMADGLRATCALISASPEQDRWRAAFHSAPSTDPSDAVDLPPGGTTRRTVRMTLRREQVHVVTVRGRPMFAAMLLCDLRWRAGLGIRRVGADFLLGTAGQGARPGPIWLDRPAPRALAAIRYTPPGS
ncbi:hypothetical protein [Sphingomonas sp. TDK1]|uniref:hypothetical protein n=1 Tax=Sphingomonas sp. TDK1 TaxID=453247 RepID=UPI0007DA25D4|nr:hypothetical protein [Sphingomonas sp. TDK1]OAN57198.1 hypothetical protein A7X12_08220 [Sphingomonas sp. TDK1]